MKRFVIATALLLLPAASSFAAPCVQVGSQIVCDWRSTTLSFGTQTDADEPMWPIQSFSGRDAMLVPPPPARPGLAVGLQSFSNDPADCHSIGNETYCY
ncbi:MAG TPA: hypothetical protein VGR62_13445 [Candidatus Binatia bacterium]|jgi:hypothetical protein|nr:hypothetical protein [Candidatus Binatia bacterium]